MVPLTHSPAPPPADDRSRELALETIYREHAAAVSRWAARLGGPHADLEDLVQDIFLVARRLLPAFRGDAQVATWLYRITENVTRARRRKQRVRDWLLRARHPEIQRTLSPAQPTPVEEVERRQAEEVVYRILDRLPDKYRDVLILFELEGLSGDEIAALTGAKVGNVWVRLHRARARFVVEMKRDAVKDRTSGSRP